MNIEAERLAFELWATSPPIEANIERWPNDAERFAWPEDYQDIAVSLAWDAWIARAEQARREQE